MPAELTWPHRSPPLNKPAPSRSAAPDWRASPALLHASRALDDIEETRLLPERKVLYQFSARGHDLAQILLGLQSRPIRTTRSTVYYRSRPLMLALGVSLEDAAAATAGAQRHPSAAGATSVSSSTCPADGGVDRAAGVRRCRRAVHARGGLGAGDPLPRTRCWAMPPTRAASRWSWGGCLGGHQRLLVGAQHRHDAQLPMLFYIEDNGFGISVPSTLQTPGGNIARQPARVRGLAISRATARDPAEAPPR